MILCKVTSSRRGTLFVGPSCSLISLSVVQLNNLLKYTQSNKWEPIYDFKNIYM